MGMVIDGEWIDDDEKYRNPTGGAFVRAESVWRDTITADGSSGFKAEPGRYHLFLAPSCPWAHRTQMVRRLKGLEKENARLKKLVANLSLDKAILEEALGKK